MRVILKRGALPDIRYPATSRTRAWQRAESLGWLHGIEPRYAGDDTIIVDASEYYKDRKPMEPFKDAGDFS
jgi:hypothetical protein